MISLSNLNNLNGLVQTQARKAWYTDQDLALNGVFPSLIHQYDKGRYASNGTVTNVNTFSQTFTDASYNKVRTSVTANAAIAPDGTLTADALIEDTTPAATHAITKVITGPATVGAPLTVSFYVKANGRSVFRFQIPAGLVASSPTGVFNLATGATSNSGTILGMSLTPEGNGWFRCSMSATVTTGGNTGQINAWISIVDASFSYDGDGVSGVFLWGMQAEYTASVSKYVPTTTTSNTVTFPMTTRPFPFQTTRTTNATMFDATRQMVWTPHNLLSNSTNSSAWSTTISGTGVLPVLTPDFGTDPNGNTTATRIQLDSGAAGQSTVNFQLPNTEGRCTFSIWMRSLAGDVVVTMFVGDATSNRTVTDTWQRFDFTGNNVSVNSQGRISKRDAWASTGTADLLVWQPQVERTGPNSPQRQIPTTGSSIFLSRFDHNPLTLEPRGALIESAKTNIINLADAIGQSGGTNTVAPTPIMGDTETRRFTADATFTGHFAFATGTGSQAGSTVHTISVYARYVDVQFVQLASTIQASQTTDYANFDLINGTITAVGSTATATIENCGNGVYRLSMTYTSIAVTAGGAPMVLATLVTGTDTRIQSHNTIGSVDFMGMQSEVGAYASSLIPTFGTPATRGADQFISLTGSWLNNTKGTVYVDFIRAFVPPAVGLSVTFAQLYTDGANRVVLLGGSSTASQHRFDVFDGGVAQTQLQSSVGSTSLQRRKMAGLYSNNLFRRAENGAGGADDTAGTIPQLPLLSVGSSNTTTQLDGWVREFRYYPEANASNAQLQALTAI